MRGFSQRNAPERSAASTSLKNFCKPYDANQVKKIPSLSSSSNGFNQGYTDSLVLGPTGSGPRIPGFNNNNKIPKSD